MFKKLNKLYTAVFGNGNNSIGGSPESERPLMDTVRSHEWKIKSLSQTIEALIERDNLEVRREYSELGDHTKVILVKRKNQ